MKPLVSIIIPFYNEGKQIISIVRQLQLSKYKPQIIVVDDGSIPSSAKNLNNLKDIKLITHPQNRGKSQALATGLKSSTGEIIVFLDSDLLNFYPKHLNSLIEPIINNYADMVVGEFLDGFRIFNYIGQTVIFSGIRSFKRSIINQHLDIFNNQGNINGYLIESKLNQVFFDKYRVVKTKLPNLTQDYKWQKFGLIPGISTDIKMMLNIYRYLGIKNYLSQLKFARSLK